MRAVYASIIIVFQFWIAVNKVHAHYGGSNPFLEAAELSNSMDKLDECFCELSGPVDTCCCDVETVDSLNYKVYPIASQIIEYTFFKFFKIDLNRPCPFWSNDGRCVLKNCHVDTCTEEEIPSFLKGVNDTPNGRGVHHVTSCDEITEEEKQLSTVIIADIESNEHQDEFNEWEDENFCQLEDDINSEGSYVDLLLNPERYTGYAGHSTNRIWSAIYNENCFKSDQLSTQLQDLCLEKRAFYRLISGLHASINIHLSAQYIISGGSTDSPKFGPNLNEFVRRFDSFHTKGQGPGWLKNLYFAYLVVLRAVVKAEDLWLREDTFHTLNQQEDELVVQDMIALIAKAKECGHNLFDESQMFRGDASEQLKEEFRLHFKNISRIMDCVGCDKCRLWGTIQVQGIGTALKILFNEHNLDDNEGLRLPTHYLSRSEIVTLFNVLARFSESIEYVYQFKQIKATPIINSDSFIERHEL